MYIVMEAYKSYRSIGDINTKYKDSHIDFYELIDNIIRKFRFDEDRDEDFYKQTKKKNRFTYENIKTINEFYNKLKSLKTTFKNKRTIISKLVDKIYYDKINYTFDEIIENPVLLKEYDITFKSIDEISIENEWWTFKSDIRHEMYVIVIIDDICNKKGHVYIEPEYIETYIDTEDYHIIKKKILDILFLNEEFRKNNGISISHGKKISLKKYKWYELNMNNNIDKIINIKYNYNKLKQSDFVEYYLDDGKKLSKEQVKAINLILKYNMSGIIGKGGSGKTSWVVKYLCKYLISEDPNINILFLTPTHTAKNRGKNELKELNKHISFSTIHSVISKYSKSDDDDELTSKLNESLDNGVKYIIIDEMSMIDLPRFSKFLEICMEYDKLHIVLLGDINQLYPVGIGCPFRDLIHCKKNFKKVELTKNYRSNGDIVPFCDTILNNDIRWTLDHDDEDSLTNIYTNDIFYNFTNNYKDIDEELKKLLNDLKSKGYKPHSYDKLNDKTYQIITYTNKDCIEYSKYVRNLYSDKNTYKEYEKGDPIIVKKNDSDKGIYNGDEGTIIKIIGDFDYKILFEETNGVNIELVLNKYDIKPALARTVHASQGSQFNIIIYVCKNNYYLDLNINYTAYSRAKEKLYLIGNINCFNSDKVRNKSEPRNTFISLEYENKYGPVPE